MPWERELDVLEEAIRRLGAEFDAFLYGGATRPPGESRKHVEQMIRRLSVVNFDVASERYRFNTLQGRYTTQTERWERLQGEKEAGRRPGLYGHFAPISERSPAAPSKHASPPNAAPSSPVEKREGVSADQRLFETYLAARRARGEDVNGYGFDQFAEGLARERSRLKEKLGTDDVVFEVAEREGRVKLIAKRPAPAGSPAGPKK